MANLIDYYPQIRVIHATTAILSFVLLLIRSYFLLHAKHLLRYKVVKISPHIIDTILFTSAITLAITGGFSVNLENPWIITKIFLLLLYILSGLYLFRLASEPKQIYTALSVSSFLYLYIILVALTKQPFPLLAL